MSVFVFPVGIGRLVVFAAKKIAPQIVIPGIDIYNLTAKEEQLAKMKDRGTKSAIRLSAEIDQIKHLHNTREEFFANRSNRAQQVTIKTADNVDLDACEIINPDQAAGAPGADQKWMIFLHGNAGCYEGHLEEFKTTARETGVNILSANYRGVMRSKGSPESSHDLVLDGEAQVQYLLSKGVRLENIVIHGWSLGGAVGAEVAANHPGINFISDRSFSTINDVVKAWIPKYYIGNVLGKVAYIAGWKFDSVKNYLKITGKKVIIFSKVDGVIRYPASLYKGVKEALMTDEDRKLKAERDKSKANPKVRTYNQDYKRFNVYKFNLGSKSERAEIIKESGPYVHTLSLHSQENIQRSYFNRVRLVLDIHEKTVLQKVWTGFRRMLPV